MSWQIAALAAGITLGFATAAASAQQLTEIKISYQPALYWALPFYVAEQKGWFAGGFNGQKLNPGDAVIVPEDFDRFNWTRELKDWSQIFYQFALGVAGLKVLSDL